MDCEYTLCMVIGAKFMLSNSRRTETQCYLLPEIGQPDRDPAEPLTVAAEPTTWRALLDGTANINSELKTLRLRYLTNVQGGPDGRWNEIHALGLHQFEGCFCQEAAVFD